MSWMTYDIKFRISAARFPTLCWGSRISDLKVECVIMPRQSQDHWLCPHCNSTNHFPNHCPFHAGTLSAHLGGLAPTGQTGQKPSTSCHYSSPQPSLVKWPPATYTQPIQQCAMISITSDYTFNPHLVTPANTAMALTNTISVLTGWDSPPPSTKWGPRIPIQTLTFLSVNYGITLTKLFLSSS